MGSSKKTSSASREVPPAPPTLFAWTRPSGWNVLISLTCLGVLFYAASEAWRHYGTAHFRTAAYQIDASEIVVTPPPAWVRADVKGEALRTASFTRVSLLDRDVTRQVSQAFTLHPWVSEVQRVRKAYPARLEVRLKYRRPVAMVEVLHDGKAGLLPIADDGTLLPPQDFSAGMAKTFPRIKADDAFPTGSVGSAWGDERIAAAARLADCLIDGWTSTPLHRITVQSALEGTLANAPTLELVTRDGRRFIWGHAPGAETSGEPTASAKREKLLNALKSAGNDAGSAPVDLRF